MEQYRYAWLGYRIILHTFKLMLLLQYHSDYVTMFVQKHESIHIKILFDFCIRNCNAMCFC